MMGKTSQIRQLIMQFIYQNCRCRDNNSTIINDAKQLRDTSGDVPNNRPPLSSSIPSSPKISSPQSTAADRQDYVSTS